MHRSLLFTLGLIVACGARTSLDPDDDGSAVSSSAGGNPQGGNGGAPVDGGGGAGAIGGMGGVGGLGGNGGDPTDITVTDTVTSSPPPCLSDAECDDAIDCTLDRCEPTGCTNQPSDDFCDDDLLCTRDRCRPDTGGCTNFHSDDACNDGTECTRDRCDDESQQCINSPCDVLCDDGSFCNGVERCDAVLGCTLGSAACSLEAVCANTACDENASACEHTFPPGCAAPNVHLLITDVDGRLYQLSPYGTPSQTLIANGGTLHLDIAVLNGRWFVADFSFIRELVPGTNTVLRTVGPNSANSLGGGPDGMLYTADTLVHRVHPDTGATTTVASLPEGHFSSGDVAFLGTRLFVSTESPCGGGLVEVDLVTGTSTLLGGDGLGCVYGLATVDDVLYVVNCDGKIGTFDPDSGEMVVVATTTAQSYGADALP